MRIAFVSGNQEKLPDAVVPLGVLYVMASAPECHARVLIDLCFEREPERVLTERLRAFRPDLVALGMRNIQSNDYSGIGDNLAHYARLVAATREATSAPIVIGGSGFSVMPRELMLNLRPDFGISGEAEGAFPQLLEALESGRADFDDIAGLHWHQGDELRSNASRGFLELDAIARPDRSLADPRYYDRYGIESIQSKRGCPLRCDYCTYPLIEGRIGRARTPSAVVDEMFAALAQHPGIGHFFIVDSVFNLPRSHAKAVCRELIDRGWTVPWTCYANPLGFDRELAELARAAGCAGMEVGSDSGCDEVLVRLHKGFTTAHVRALHEHCAHAGVADCHTFILGTLGETLDDARRTLDFAAELDPWSAIFMLWIDDHEAIDEQLRAERNRARGRIAEILREYAATQPTWSVPSLRINFDERLFARLRRRGFHGPLWQHMRARVAADSSSAPAPPSA
jgi:radical SAM superfamily enzyme YgiQ (UPF0313 family)